MTKKEITIFNAEYDEEIRKMMTRHVIDANRLLNQNIRILAKELTDLTSKVEGVIGKQKILDKREELRAKEQKEL